MAATRQAPQKIMDDCAIPHFRWMHGSLQGKQKNVTSTCPIYFEIECMYFDCFFSQHNHAPSSGLHDGHVALDRVCFRL